MKIMLMANAKSTTYLEKKRFPVKKNALKFKENLYLCETSNANPLYVSSGIVVLPLFLSCLKHQIISYIPTLHPQV